MEKNLSWKGLIDHWHRLILDKLFIRWIPYYYAMIQLITKYEQDHRSWMFKDTPVQGKLKYGKWMEKCVSSVVDLDSDPAIKGEVWIIIKQTFVINYVYHS